MFSNTAGNLFSTNTLTNNPGIGQQNVQNTTLATAPSENPNKDYAIPNPPEDSVTSLKFLPVANPNANFLLSSSWEGSLRIWEINSHMGGTVTFKTQQSCGSPILDSCWSPDGSKIFAGSADNKGYMWDVASNQMQQFAAHDASIKSVHCIQCPAYTCVMTTSWDKTLKMWDLRQSTAVSTMQLPERSYRAAVHFPLAVVATAGRQVLLYNLEGNPREYQRIESPLKFQSTSLAIFLDRNKQQPNGYALGCIEGRVGIQYLNPPSAKDNFTFKCHRSTVVNNLQEIFVVNDIAFHPTLGTLATIGSDGRYTFWDKDAQTKLKTSEQVYQPLTRCTFDPTGVLFAYASGYDWSRGHEGNDPNKKPQIFLRQVMEEMKPTVKKN